MSASSKKKLRKEENAARMTEKQKREQKEAKQLKIYTRVFAIIMVVVLVVGIGVLVKDPIERAVIRNSHAITVGEHKISAADLNYFYMDAISKHQEDVYNQYGQSFGDYWTIMLGFEPSKPLNEQNYDTKTGKTWATYFAETAVKNAREMYSLYIEANAKGYKIPADEQADVDAYLESLDLYAAYSGLNSANEYLRMTYGSSANYDDYSRYYNICTLAASYLDKYSADLEYKPEDYRAYEKDKFDDYTSFSLAHYTIRMNSYLGEGTKDENGNAVYSEADKAAAREALKADLETILGQEIKDKASFDKAIQSLTINQTDKDGKPIVDSKKPTATEIKDAFLEDIVIHADALEWIKETNRVPGEIKAFDVYTYAEHEDPEHEHDDDCGCARTTDGYTIVLFNERNENKVNLVNVRHILVKFEGGTKGEDGNTVYSEVEKETAKTAAEKLLQQWKDGKANEDSFAELANKESDDQGGKVTNGGLYEDVFPGQMVENFENWCFAEGRQAGDTGIVETEYGYHVMYYVSADEMTYRDLLIEVDLRNEDTEKWRDALIEKTPYEEVDLSRLDYGIVLNRSH